MKSENVELERCGRVNVSAYASGLSNLLTLIGFARL